MRHPGHVPAAAAAAVHTSLTRGPQDIYNTMGRSTATIPGALDPSRTSIDGASWAFPPATIAATQAMVTMLARELRVADALDVVARIRSRGLPAADEVPFGVVVSSPLAPDKPLTARLCHLCTQPRAGRAPIAEFCCSVGTACV